MTHRDEALDEVCRGEGRGSPEFYNACCECKTPGPSYRCARGTCFGQAMYCEQCIVKRHRQLPTHVVEKWQGSFFTPMNLNLVPTEARFQLGHPAGSFCTRSVRGHADFVIMDVLGISTMKINFCDCDTSITHRQQLLRVNLWPATSVDPQTCATFNVLRLFEAQNCLGKISAYDFVRSLELLTNNDGLQPTPDRRRAFRAIARQYRNIVMMKRAGRGHDDSGVKGTKQGELALKCRACPEPGVNMEEGWDKVDCYKDTLLLSKDANFKLINRNVSTEQRDPVHDDGMGYFCNRGEYSTHIRKNVDEEEISSCSGFQAMFLANVKRVKGLRVTGIGGVTCARHNMWRPNGLGDLQVGERFCNMDFIFFAAIMNFALMALVLSYDIACQFSKKLWTRMPKLPSKYHLDHKKVDVRFMVPNFHLPPHKTGCHSPFSFHFLWGAGLTHGETVEQNWEFLNGIAAATKMMGLGARAMALEGLFAFHNWRRQVAHRSILKRRMAEAIKGGKEHSDCFKAFHEGLMKARSELVSDWKERVDKWERTAHLENEKNSPYEYEEAATTLKEVRLKLADEEYARTGDGTEVEREDTPSTFISMGMELEESQYVNDSMALILGLMSHQTTTGAIHQGLDILRQRTQLRIRLTAFRKLQGTYMPKLRRYLTPAQRVIWDADDKEPEATRLFLPSDLESKIARLKACARGLDGVESRMRQGEAGEALDAVRTGLRCRTATTRFKIRNWSGQRALTRGQGILRQVNIKIHAGALRYRYARHALLKLRGHGDWEKKWRVLAEDDIRALNERSLTEEEQAERERLRDAGEVPDEGGIAALGDVVSGETHRTLSWIWYAASDKEGDDEKLHEALRVEWAKAYSRSNRWREELVMLEAEMSRTIRGGRTAEQVWIARSSARTLALGKSTAMSPEVAEGVRAYALEQADRERRVCERLEKEWGPIRQRAAEYLRGDDISNCPEIVVGIDREALRWAEATMHEAEEVENDMYQ
ncbi:hypothetical protein DFH06DRAFT_983104 [Mycena polygramma]|nr:hypothetical protein DFH06DRAFT_983104 [Mycena polygramma]